MWRVLRERECDLDYDVRNAEEAGSTRSPAPKPYFTLNSPRKSWRLFLQLYRELPSILSQQHHTSPLPLPDRWTVVFGVQHSLTTLINTAYSSILPPQQQWSIATALAAATASGLDHANAMLTIMVSLLEKSSSWWTYARRS